MWRQQGRHKTGTNYWVVRMVLCGGNKEGTRQERTTGGNSLHPTHGSHGWNLTTTTSHRHACLVDSISTLIQYIVYFWFYKLTSLRKINFYNLLGLSWIKNKHVLLLSYRPACSRILWNVDVLTREAASGWRTPASQAWSVSHRNRKWGTASRRPSLADSWRRFRFGPPGCARCIPSISSRQG